MRPNTFLRCATLALLLTASLAPCAAASSGDLLVKQATLQGEAVLDGRCEVVHYFGRDGGDSAALAISGEVVRLELDTAWANVTAVVSVLPREYSTSRDEYHNGTFAATGFRADHTIFLADIPGRATPRLQWTGASGRLEPSQSGTVDQLDRNTQGHPQRSIGVAGTVAWVPSPGWTTLLATGDFYLALWEVDGRASDGSHSGIYTTGHITEGPATPLPPGFTALRSENRLLHVFAFNATLEWRFRQPVPDEVVSQPGVLGFHVKEVAVESPAPILLSDTTGTIGGNGARVDVHGSEVRLASGRLDSVRATAGGLALRLTAPDDALSVDGQPIVWPRQDPGLPRWGVALALVALAVGLAAAWRWSTGGLRRLERRMDRGRYADVVARRGRVRVRTRQAPQASVLHAVSLLALGRHDEAGRFLEGLAASERPEPPTLSYLLAAARAGQGRTAEAKRLLRDCLEAAPEYIAEAVANPSLLPLLQASGPIPSSPRPLREGAEGGG